MEGGSLRNSAGLRHANLRRNEVNFHTEKKVLRRWDRERKMETRTLLAIRKKERKR